MSCHITCANQAKCVCVFIVLLASGHLYLHATSPLVPVRPCVCSCAPQDLSLHELSGWRDVDEERIHDLKTSFRGGKYGLTVTSGIWILAKTDPDGERLIDDGRSAVGALRQLHNEHDASPDMDPETNEPWDARLVQILLQGVECKVQLILQLGFFM